MSRMSRFFVGLFFFTQAVAIHAAVINRTVYFDLSKLDSPSSDDSYKLVSESIDPFKIYNGDQLIITALFLRGERLKLTYDANSGIGSQQVLTVFGIFASPPTIYPGYGADGVFKLTGSEGTIADEGVFPGYSNSSGFAFGIATSETAWITLDSFTFSGFEVDTGAIRVNGGPAPVYSGFQLSLRPFIGEVIASVPNPATFTLLGIGLAGLGVARLRRTRQHCRSQA